MKPKGTSRQDGGTKSPLTYRVCADHEGEIRRYVDHVAKSTGLPKGRIVTELLVEAVRRCQKFLSGV